jgi:hypothetical protein
MIGIDRRPRTPHRKLRALAAYSKLGMADGVTILLNSAGQYAVNPSSSGGISGTGALAIKLDASGSGLSTTAAGLKVSLVEPSGLSITGGTHLVLDGGNNASGLILGVNGLKTVADTGRALSVGANGIGIVLDGSSLTQGSSGLKVTATSGGFTVLFDHYADVGNVNTDETDLYSDTIAGGQFAANGAKIQAEYAGTIVPLGTADRELKLYFAGNLLVQTAPVLDSPPQWIIRLLLIRVSGSGSSGIVRYAASIMTGVHVYDACGELTGLTLANTQILKVTGQTTGTGSASNDILAKMGTVTYAPAA